MVIRGPPCQGFPLPTASARGELRPPAPRAARAGWRGPPNRLGNKLTDGATHAASFIGLFDGTVCPPLQLVYLSDSRDMPTTLEGRREPHIHDR